MIIVKLMGGLGNQMFQYALGRRLALDRKVPFFMDTAWFQTQSLRGLGLTEYKIAQNYAAKESIQRLTMQYPGFMPRFYRRIEPFLPYYYKRVVKEKGEGFDRNILKVLPNTYLQGYWQNEQYFKPIVKVLREEFQLVNDFDSENQAYKESIQACTAVCIHVRHGDYIQNQHTNLMHGTCPVDYYRQAGDFLKARVAKPSFFVFTDDRDWVIQNLSFLKPDAIISSNNPVHDAQHMQLMSLCQHFIIANSSFSWWGAYLSQNQGRIVIAPKQWLRDEKRNSDFLLPNGWIRL